MKDIEFHEFANEYPLMPEADLDRAADDMAINGFDERFPIVIYKKKILDGRDRFRAAKKAGIKPAFITFKGDEDAALAFVKRANEGRKHFTPEFLSSRRDERINRVAEARKAGESIRSIAEKEHVSISQVQRDLAKAGVSDDTGAEPTPENGTVAGKDGSTHPATKPQRTKGAKATGNGKEPDEPKDAFGNVIPKKLRDVYADAWIQETIDYLGVTHTEFLKQRMATAISKRKKYHPFIAAQADDFIQGVTTVGDMLEKMLEHLKKERPAGVCPMCAGKGCPDCGMSGLVPRHLYKELKDKAKEAAKAAKEAAKAEAATKEEG